MKLTPGEIPAFEKPATGTPLYREIKRSLSLAIEGGQWRVGEPLPSEGDLAQVFGVSIGTVRHAMDGLVTEGLIRRRQGKGTFVAEHTPEQSLYQFFHVERHDGLRELPKVELISFERARLNEECSAALHLSRGEPGIVIENSLSLRGRPIIYDRLALPASLFRGLTEKRFRERHSTIYNLFQIAFGVTVVRGHERASATNAAKTACRVLGLPLGAPVMRIKRVALTFDDRPVEYRVSIVNTDQHDYVRPLTRSELVRP
jgi:GntR family transcriptional regulator